MRWDRSTPRVFWVAKGCPCCISQAKASEARVQEVGVASPTISVQASWQSSAPQQGVLSTISTLSSCLFLPLPPPSSSSTSEMLINEFPTMDLHAESN